MCGVGIGKTVKEKVCVHTSRDIRAIASQLVSVWLEVFRKEKASNGGLKLSRQATGVDSLKRKTVRDPSSGKPPLHMYHGAFEHKGSLQDSASTGSHLPSNPNVKKVNGKAIKLETAAKLETNSSRFGGSTGRPHNEDFAMTEEERAAIAAAEAARAAALAAAKVCSLVTRLYLMGYTTASFLCHLPFPPLSLSHTVCVSFLIVVFCRHMHLQKPRAVHCFSFLRFPRFINLLDGSSTLKWMSMILGGSGLVVFWVEKIVYQKLTQGTAK